MKNILFLFLSLTILACNNPDSDIKKQDNNARETIIDASEINNKIKNNKPINYSNSVIIGDVDFTASKDYYIETPGIIRHISNSSVMFSNCTFKGKVIASKNNEESNHFLQFSKNIDFVNCTFQSKIDFKETEFERLVLFRQCICQDSTIFQGAFFRYKQNYFIMNKFLKFTDFSRTVFRGKTSFIKSEFHDNLLFSSSVFFDDINFSATTYHKKSFFSTNNYKGKVNYNTAIFYDLCNFNNSRFYDTSKFNDCKVEKELSFQNCMFIFPNETNNVKTIKNISYTNSTILLQVTQSEHNL